MKHIVVCLSLILSGFLFSGQAQAKGVLVFNHGEELFEVAAFPAEVVSKLADVKNYKLGYKCSHIGLFWADAWTWDCKLVAANVEAKSYGELPDDVVSQLQANPEFAFSKAQRSFWNHYGFLLLLVGLVGLALLGKHSAKPKAGE